MFTSRDGESMESYYSRFYKLMNELTRNNLQVTTMQVNVQFLQQLQPEWSRFVTVVKQSKEIDTISYHTLFDILKQYQNEVNDIRAERIAKSANPLALLAAAQPYSDNYYQAPKPQRSNATSSSTRPSASTRHKGKEIAKPVTPQSESVSEEDSDPEKAHRDKEMQKNLALLEKYFKKLYKPTNNNLRTSSNSKNKTEDTPPRYKNDNQSGQFGNQRTMTVAGARETIGSQVVQQNGIQYFNCKGFRHYGKECRKPKQVKDYTYHKEKMMMCKQVEKGVPLQAEQADWLEDTDEEIDEQELEVHYGFMAKIQEVLPAESSSTDQPLEQVDQNATECVDECAALANLITNLTLDTKENKKILKQLKKANASLTQELKECKTNLDKTNSSLGEATSCRDSCLIAFQNKQTEFEKYKAFNDRTIDYEILQTKLNETLGLLALKDIEIKEGLKTKAYEVSVLNQKHDELVKKSLLTKSQLEGRLKDKTKVIWDLNVKEGKDIDKNDSFRFENELKTEMHEDFEYVKSLEQEIDELESKKANFSNIYDLLLEECVSKDVICSYLHSPSELDAFTELKCLYLHKVKECKCLAQNLSKQTKTMSVENVSLDLVPQGQKASDYDNSGPVPPIQDVVPSEEKINSSQKELEFLFSPLFEKCYTLKHVYAKENTNDQATNASFQEAEFINPFCTPVQDAAESSSPVLDIAESSSRNDDTIDMHSFQPQMSIVEQKNIKEAMADSAWIKAMLDELHQFDRLKV
ncbi:hypothetical protein Tco_1105587 [Tanacetum coccineum]